jgi:hypothetical protein
MIKYEFSNIKWDKRLKNTMKSIVEEWMAS